MRGSVSPCWDHYESSSHRLSASKERSSQLSAPETGNVRFLRSMKLYEPFWYLFKPIVYFSFIPEVCVVRVSWKGAVACPSYQKVWTEQDVCLFWGLDGLLHAFLCLLEEDSLYKLVYEPGDIYNHDYVSVLFPFRILSFLSAPKKLAFFTSSFHEHTESFAFFT